MDPTKMTTLQLMMIGGALGVVIGLIPLITGIVKKNLKFGVFGFLGSILGGALLSLILAIPVAVIFTWFILRNARGNSELQVNDNGPQNA